MMEKWLSSYVISVTCEEVGGYILGKVKTTNLSCYFCKLLHRLGLILPTHKEKLGGGGITLKSQIYAFHSLAVTWYPLVSLLKCFIPNGFISSRPLIC